MEPSVTERRTVLRRKVSLNTRVKGFDGNGTSWTESTFVSTISRRGAGFLLDRRCAVGQLVSMIMPMPTDLRCYDEDRDLYQTWAVVQYSAAVSARRFNIGVAFIGKNAPASSRENPNTSYRITGVGDGGLWNVVETDHAFIPRKHSRFGVALDVTVSYTDIENQLCTDDAARTENISLSGAAVTSRLDASVGDRIDFICKNPQFSSLAIVRNSNRTSDTRWTLNLEFIDKEFPIKDTFVKATDAIHDTNT